MQAIRQPLIKKKAKKGISRKINLHLKDAQMKRLQFHTEHEPAAEPDHEGASLSSGRVDSFLTSSSFVSLT